MEFLLPVFLKLFPNMLPSTFQDKMKEQVLIVMGVASVLSNFSLNSHDILTFSSAFFLHFFFGTCYDGSCMEFFFLNLI